MNWSIASRDILSFAAVGAALGAIIGLLFYVADTSINPFTPIAIGMFLGSLASMSRQAHWTDGPASRDGNLVP